MPDRDVRAIVAHAVSEGRGALTAQIERAGISVLFHAEDACVALTAVEQFRPDVLATDCVLAMGDGVELARRVLRLPLAVYPGILLFYAGKPPVGAEDIRDSGVAMLDKSASTAEILSAVDAVLPENRRIPADQIRRIDHLMDRLCVPRHAGRDYLTHAICLCYMDRRLVGRLTKGLYPMIARRFSVRAARVEQAMRHVIDLAWKNGAIDAQYELFRGTIDAQRGKPTCGEMIAQLADILRMEGK